eukprot:2676962-Lingulodinium_polyedra.AAC.1
MLVFELFAPGQTALDCGKSLACRLGPTPEPFGPLRPGPAEATGRFVVQPLCSYQDLYAWAYDVLAG